MCDDGQVVAVKLLYNLKQTVDDEQFIREFKNLMMLKHPNIVRLIGYCYETQHQPMDFERRFVFSERIHKALCFEYKPQGSLHDRLSGMRPLQFMYITYIRIKHVKKNDIYVWIPLITSLYNKFADKCNVLDWQTRYKIIKGACEGLKYLHEGFKEPIYHMDLKPDNILLDENMMPKLTGFGLSKIVGDERSMVTSSRLGTM